MIDLCRAGGGGPPGGFTQRDLYSLWFAGKPFLAEAKDWYTAFAGRTEGQCQICESYRPLIGPHLSATGIEVKQILVGRTEEGADAHPGTAYVSRWDLCPEGSPVGLIAAPLGSFETAWRRDARRTALIRLSRNLSEGGRLLLDVINWGGTPEHNFDGLQRLALDQRDAQGGSLLIWESWRLAGTASGAAELGLAAEAVSPDGVVWKKRYARFLCAVIDPDELEEQAAGAGLVKEALFGGFDGEPFSPEAPRQVWVFRKAGGVML